MTSAAIPAVFFYNDLTSRVKSFVGVGLPRPRNLIELQKAPEFGELVHRIWSGLRDEVQRARDQENREIST